MSTSLLYHAFGVRGYRYVKTAYVEGAATFTIEQPRVRTKGSRTKGSARTKGSGVVVFNGSRGS